MTKQIEKQEQEVDKYHNLVEQAKIWVDESNALVDWDFSQVSNFPLGEAIEQKQRSRLRFDYDLVRAVQEVATRVYRRTESKGIEDDLKDLVQLRYAHVLGNHSVEAFSRIIDQTSCLIRDKLDYLRVREIRESLRESIRREAKKK